MSGLPTGGWQWSMSSLGATTSPMSGMYANGDVEQRFTKGIELVVVNALWCCYRLMDCGINVTLRRQATLFVGHCSSFIVSRCFVTTFFLPLKLHTQHPYVQLEFFCSTVCWKSLLGCQCLPYPSRLLSFTRHSLRKCFEKKGFIQQKYEIVSNFKKCYTKIILEVCRVQKCNKKWYL